MTVVTDTPEGIELYRLLAITKGLDIEIKLIRSGWPPTAGPTRGMALGAARRALQKYNVPGPPAVALGTWPRTRKQALAAMQELCTQQGINLSTKGEPQ